MKKLVLLPLIIFMLSCSSDDDKEYTFEFYLVNTENAECLEANIREANLNSNEEDIQDILDFFVNPWARETTKSEAEKIVVELTKYIPFEYKKDGCSAEYAYRRVD